MVKYILRESELRSAIEKVVKEELNEGLGHALGSALLNTAKYAALGAIAPGALISKGITKADDIMGGNSTVGGTINDFFGSGPNGSGRGSSSSSKTKKSSEQIEKERRANTATIKKEYGEPATEAGLGRRLERKERMVVDNFLGSGESVDFGRHYREVNQDANNSVWMRKLIRAEQAINNAQNQNRVERYRRQYYRRFREWLNERDKAYEAYIKSSRQK